MAWNKYDIEFFNQLPPDDAEEWLIHRTACDKSLFFFIKEVGGYSLEAGGNADPIIHKPICDFWQDPTIRKKFVYEPRYWEKSTKLSKWGNLHSYLQDQEERILLASQKLDLPQGFLRTIKAWVLNNARLRWLYPILQLVDSKWKNSHPFSSEEIVLPRIGDYDAPTFKAIGITGAAQGGHYTIISPDDLIGEKGMTSAAVMEQAFRWFDNIDELMTDKFDVIRGVGTHWAVGDIGHYIQESYPEFQWMIATCLKDSTLPQSTADKPHITWIQNPNVEEDQCNWAGKFIDEDAGEDLEKDYDVILERATEHYHKMRLNPEKQMVFYSQHMNNPRDSEITDFKAEWLRYYQKCVNDDGETFYRYEYTTEVEGKLRSSVRDCYRADMRVRSIIDPSSFTEGGMKKGLANTAITTIGVDQETNKKLLLESWSRRPGKTEILYDEIFRIHDKHRPTSWHVDCSGQQGWVLKSIREEAKRREKRLPITGLPADVRSDAKGVRIRSLTDDFSAHMIFMDEGMKNFVREYLRYPMPGTKDLLDSMSYHKIFWSKLKRGDLEKSNRKRYQEYRQSLV